MGESGKPAWNAGASGGARPGPLSPCDTKTLEPCTCSEKPGVGDGKGDGETEGEPDGAGVAVCARIGIGSAFASNRTTSVRKARPAVSVTTRFFHRPLIAPPIAEKSSEASR